jgi:hypothetical protein
VKKFAAGLVVLALGIAVPATFHGTRFLIVLCAVIAVAGLSLILTSRPVVDRALMWLRRELPIQPAPAPNEGLVAARVIRGELKNVRARVVDALADQDDWWRTLPDLPTTEWKRHGTALAAGPLGVYDAVRAAYGQVDRVSSACLEEDLRERTSGHRSKGVPKQLGDEMIEAIDAANETLRNPRPL